MTKVTSANDIIGREMQVGDAVAFRHSSYKTMEMGRISRFTNKKILIKWTINGREQQHYAYPEDCVLLPLEDYMMHAFGRS